jgi:hypothetical protein
MIGIATIPAKSLSKRIEKLYLFHKRTQTNKQSIQTVDTLWLN